METNLMLFAICHAVAITHRKGLVQAHGLFEKIGIVVTQGKNETEAIKMLRERVVELSK